MNILHEALFEDGSGWELTVTIRLANGKSVMVGAAMGVRGDVRVVIPGVYAKARQFLFDEIIKIALPKIKAIPAEWFQLHREMYAEFAHERIPLEQGIKFRAVCESAPKSKIVKLK